MYSKPYTVSYKVIYYRTNIFTATRSRVAGYGGGGRLRPRCAQAASPPRSSPLVLAPPLSAVSLWVPLSAALSLCERASRHTS